MPGGCPRQTGRTARPVSAMWINNARSTTLAVHSLPRTLPCPSEKAASPARRRSAVSSWERRPPAPVRVPPTLPGIRSAARLCRGSIPPGRHVRSCCSSVSCFAPSRAHAARGWFRSQIKGRSRRPRQTHRSRWRSRRCRRCRQSRNTWSRRHTESEASTTMYRSPVSLSRGCAPC